ncbi:MAG: FecR domain-containing protein [Gammaproteobacteria bacterium]
MFSRLAAGAIVGVLAIASVQAHAVEKVTVGNAKVIVKTVTGTFEADLRQINLLDDIYHNEVVETGDASATELVFLDETKLALGPNSSLVLDRFVYDPDPDKASFVMTATAGVFRFVSGKLPKKSYEIHTPTATIGIRGTVLSIVVIPGNPDKMGIGPIVNVTVEQGVAEITSCGGKHVALVRSGQSTTISGTADGTCSAPTLPGPQPSIFATLVSESGVGVR